MSTKSWIMQLNTIKYIFQALFCSCWLWLPPHSELCWSWILVMYISPALRTKKREKKKNLVPKCVQLLNLVSRRRACLCPNGQMFGCQLSFSSLVHLPRCFICSFECCLEKPRPPLACCTSGFLPSWSYEILCGFFLPLLFLIPGCLHTSLGLRLACWTISKPGGRHDVVVILWFVNCFVMDCLNSRLIKYWQLWQDPRCSLSCSLCEFAQMLLTIQISLKWALSTIDPQQDLSEQ